MSAHTENVVKSARDLLHAGHPYEALKFLRAAAQPNDPITLQFHYARLARMISDALTDFPVVKMGFLAGSTIDHLVDVFRFWLLLEGFRLDAYLAPYDTWRQEAIDLNSSLYKFHPEVVWFFLTARDLRFSAPLDADATYIDASVSAAADDTASAVRQVISKLPALAIVNNAEAAMVRPLGNFEGTALWSQAALLRSYNLALSRTLPQGTIIFDIDHLACRFGLDRWEDFRLWCHSKHPFALDATGPTAFAGARLLAAAYGRARKCVVLDLDNTLWGGVVGDDGANGIRIGVSDGAVGEAFLAFQAYLKKLSDRGVALAVCSKNDPELAKEPFRVRPEMILKLEDFAVFCVNWRNKADNLRTISAEMNLGLESFVFIDDSPAERALVRAELPDVAVPDMPRDPADYVRAIANGAWFETLKFLDEDHHRSRSYQNNAARNAVKLQATDLDAYLRDLKMQASWGDADAATLPRLAQLLNKTNQFRLGMARYTERELSILTSDRNAWVGWFALRDRFGDYGVISAVVLRFFEKAAFIDTWAMSCRVFARGMENFIFSKLWQVSKARGCTLLEGCYFPSDKNAVVAELYAGFGGSLVESSKPGKRWRFDLDSNLSPTFKHITEGAI